eukprot:CAMPEP_0178426324 /NCGR_PEP_ID=MMETSP0689_2-20121128/29177_1 /TAXON_ID=160604 /ORGANISM="Amphidinium massartii, Strain CS-259" /LENGTH=105 /DNA_ID=CAMNT_0020048009 /DNA_START=464 /DNA_END=780 /DNA_ORIENTATION=-
MRPSPKSAYCWMSLLDWPLNPALSWYDCVSAVRTTASLGVALPAPAATAAAKHPHGPSAPKRPTTQSFTPLLRKSRENRAIASKSPPVEDNMRAAEALAAASGWQ